MTKPPSGSPPKASSSKSHNHDANAEESRRILERVERESETVGASSMARTTEQFRKHVSGIDGTSEDNDPIEVLGKRIGRTLGWIALVILVIYMLNTYIL